MKKQTLIQAILEFYQKNGKKVTRTGDLYDYFRTKLGYMPNEDLCHTIRGCQQALKAKGIITNAGHGKWVLT